MIIVAKIGKHLVGLLVDAVCDIITPTTSDALQLTPEVACESVRTALSPGLLALDGRMVSMIDLNQVLPPL